MSYVPLTQAKMRVQRITNVRAAAVVKCGGRSELLISANQPGGARMSRQVPARPDGQVSEAAVANAMEELLGAAGRRAYALGVSP